MIIKLVINILLGFEVIFGFVLGVVLLFWWWGVVFENWIVVVSINGYVVG